MNWFRNMDLIVGNLSYDSKKNSGIINFETLNNGECIGSFNFIEKKELGPFLAVKIIQPHMVKFL